MSDNLLTKLIPDQIMAMCRRGFGSEVQVESAQELGGGTFNETYVVELAGQTKVILPHAVGDLYRQAWPG